LEADLREKNKQYTELQIEHEKLKEEFEALQEKNKKYRELQKENDNLKKSCKDSDARYWKQYYETLDLNDTISGILTEEQRDEVKKILKEKEKYRSKVEDEQKKPKPLKSVLSIIDDSDDEDEGPTIRIKDNKIIKAIECECDFLD
jgi:cell shape-determining protein MreC